MTSSTAIETVVRQVLTKRLGIPSDEIAAEARLVEDLNLDSVDFVELALASESALSILLDDEALREVVTVADLIGLVERTVNDQPGAPRPVPVASQSS
jgi:acyl carrier protein